LQPEAVVEQNVIVSGSFDTENRAKKSWKSGMNVGFNFWDKRRECFGSPDQVIVTQNGKTGVMIPDPTQPTGNF
jgi:hypothetical protein